MLTQKKELEFYKFALDKSAMVTITDKEGIILYVNDKFCELSKFSRKELIGQNHRIVNSGFHPIEFFKILWETIMSGKVWKGEVKDKAKDGSFYWLDVTIVPFMDSSGNPFQFLAIRFDITQRVEAIHIKEQFLANMSHEIRTPLNSLTGFLDLISETKLSKEQKEYVNHMHNSSDILLRIVNDILDISKLEAGKIEIEHSPFVLKEEMESVKMLFANKIKSQNLDFILNIDQKIPTILFGDIFRLKQILINLINNSVKYTPKGSIQLSVEVASIKNKKYFIQFSVIDTGIGIPKEKQASIFDKFTQSRTDDARVYGGVGLGLSIVKNLVILQGGSIKLESDENKGSIFSFIIPYEKRNKILSDSKSNIKPTFSNKNIKVLIVDDSEMNRKLLGIQIYKYNFVPKFSYNGLQAVEEMRKNVYDIVLMDMQMPIMNGYEAIKVIRDEEKDKRTPIIAISASRSKEAAAKCFDIGADDFLSKPYKVEELIEKIMNFLPHNATVDRTNGRKNKQVKKNFKYIDLTYLEEQANGDQAFITEMIEYFLSAAPIALAELEKSISKKDFTNASFVAHKLISQVAFMGISIINTDLELIENCLENRVEPKDINKVTSNIINKMHLAINELKTLKINN